MSPPPPRTMTEPSSADAGAGAEALLGLAAGRSVRLPPTAPDSAPPPSSAPAPPPAFLPPVERLPGLSEWRVEPFRPPLPPPLLEPPPPDGLRASPWHSHQYAYPWHVGYAYPPSQLYYYPQPLSYQRQPLGVPPPSLMQPDVPPLRSLTSPLDKLRPLGEHHNPILPPPTNDVNSTSVQSTTSQPAPPARARGLADLINPTDTIPGTNNEVGPSHLSRAYEPVKPAPDKSSKSCLSMLVEATNEVPNTVSPEKPAVQTEPSEASTVLQHNASQSTCARPSPELVTPLRLLHKSENLTAENEDHKPMLAENALRPLVIRQNDLPQKREPRDVTRLGPNLEPVSKGSVTVVTSHSASATEGENGTVDLHKSTSPVENENVGNTHDRTVRPSDSATSIADLNAVASDVRNLESGKMPIRGKADEDQLARPKRRPLVESYSDKSSERNSDQERRTAAEDESKYHTPRSRSSRDANRSSGRRSRRSTKQRGRRSRRRPISLNGLESEDNDHDPNDSDREASDGGVPSLGDDDEEGDSGTDETRCPCGSKENSGIMIACDQCDKWQHGKCMGFRRIADLPERYFCHICRPDQVRPNCIAHPKYKERFGRDREAKESRAVEAESLLAMIRPAELRKVFMSDLKNRKSPLRSRTDVFNRYAALFRAQFPKNRQAVVEGLSVLLDLSRTEAADRFECALKRMRNDKPQEEGVDRRRNSVANEATQTEPNHRTAGSGRNHGQKRARSNTSDGVEGGTVRHDAGHIESGVEIDLNSDSRGMSREERKLQQTMKLFARMEERERERKRPRTTENGTSPRTSPPGRPKTSRAGSQVRGSAAKASVSPPVVESQEVAAKPTLSDVRQQNRSTESKHKRHLTEPTVSSPSEAKSLQKPQSLQSHPDAEQTGVSSKAPNASRSNGEPTKDINRRERDSRSRDRFEKPNSNRKDSVSPDSHSFGNRRRKHMMTEKVRSNESKRRRTGSSLRDVDRRSSLDKDFPDSERPLDIQLFVSGPSVLGSTKLMRESASHTEGERTEEREPSSGDKERNGAVKPNRKEWLLMKERIMAMNKSVGMEPDKSPVKKRLLTERRIEDIEEEESREKGEGETGERPPAKVLPTVSVSMVVVSEKKSLPDNGQILESTRLVLREEKKEAANSEREKGKTFIHALKKRPSMLAAAHRSPESEERNSKPNDLPLEELEEHDGIQRHKPSPRLLSPKASPRSPPHSSEERSSKPATPTLKMPSPRASTPKHLSSSFLSGSLATETQSSPRRRSPIASPKLRSSPLPSFKSAIRSTAKSSLRDSQSLSPMAIADDNESQMEKPPVAPATESQSSRKKSPSPSPERQIPLKSAPRTSSPQSQGNSRPEKKDTAKPERERTPSETLITKSAQTVTNSKSEAEVIPEEKKNTDEPKDPDSALTATAPIPLSRSPAPPVNALRSIRSMPVAEIRKASLAQSTSIASVDVQKPRSSDADETSKADMPSSGTTISDVFQRRLEGFWKPATKTTVKPPVKPNSAPPPVASIKGSTAKLGAALPLSSKPNLDSLRNSTGLSPRVSNMGNGYHRGSGQSFRSKSMDYERSRGSIPSFSQSKRSHSFSHGRGYARSSSHGLNSGKPSFHEDRRRFGPARDSGHHGRDDDKGKNGGTPTQLWSRSYAYRNSRPSMSDDHERNMSRRPGGGPPDSDGLRRSRKPLQESWMSMGGPRQSGGLLGMNGGSSRRMNGDGHGRGSRRGHSHHG